MESWRRNVRSADLVLIVDQMSPETVAWLRECGVGVVPASFCLARGESGWSKAARTALLRLAREVFIGWMTLCGGDWNGRADRVREAMMDVMSSRFADFARYLALHEALHGQVLLTDSRDVIFQDDPFPVSKLQVFCEDESIGSSHFARRWLQLTYGTGEFRRLADKPFICSGTTIGPMAGVLAYARKQAEQCGRVMACAGADQAVHNVIVHRGWVDADVRAFGDGVVITLNDVALDALRIIDGRVMDGSGKPYPVVHQYDRVAGLSAVLLGRLGLSR